MKSASPIQLIRTIFVQNFTEIDFKWGMLFSEKLNRIFKVKDFLKSIFNLIALTKSILIINAKYGLFQMYPILLYSYVYTFYNIRDILA